MNGQLLVMIRNLRFEYFFDVAKNVGKSIALE